MADVLDQAQQGDHAARDHQQVGFSRPVLLAMALGFAVIALAIPAHLAVLAIVPALAGVVAVLAAFRIMG